MLRSVWSFRVVLCLAACLSLRAASGEDLSYSRDIRPILAANCFACHGPDDSGRAADLRLDTFDGATALHNGTTAIVPGKPAESELVRRILSEDDNERMPPPDSHKHLTDRQKEILKRWVAEGAIYQQHWAFVPPRRPPIPAVKNLESVRNPIDRFVLATLEASRLALSAEAPAETLVRRLYLDLVGLPPSPADVDTYLTDPRPDRYERLVDALLASPHYGERWGRKWLDLARYADTNGYEKDRPRSMWPYRDWVVRALNADMPFSQFTVEQLAGDMLPDPTRDQLIATGFHRNTMLNEEGGIDPLEFRFHAMTDRVATTGTTWLALTLGCVQCHTHKYDPIRHSEYYGLMAYLNNADEPEIDLVDSADQQKTREREQKAQELLKALSAHWPVTDPPNWIAPRPVEALVTTSALASLRDDQWVALPSGAQSPDSVTFVYDVEGRVDQIELLAPLDDSLPNRGPGREPNGQFSVAELTVEFAAKSVAEGQGASIPWQPVKIETATAETSPAGSPVTNAFDGKPETTWTVPGGKDAKAQTAVFRLAAANPGKESGRWRIRVSAGTKPLEMPGRLRFRFAADVIRTPEELAKERAQRLDRALDEWLTARRTSTVAWTTLVPRSAKSNLPLLTVLEDGSVLASGDITKDDTYNVEFADIPAGVTAIRLEALPHDSLPAHGPGLAYYEGPKGDFYLGEFQLLRDGQPVKLASATESYAKNHFGSLKTSAALTLDGNPQSGWTCAGRPGERHTAVYVLEAPTSAAGPAAIRMRFGRHFAASLGRFRLSATTHPGGAVAQDLTPRQEELLRKPADQLTATEQEELRNAFLMQAPELAERTKAIRDLQRPSTVTTALVFRERPADQPRPTYRHDRGEFLQPKETVAPGLPEILRSESGAVPGDRHEFAEWLVSRRNPLTARVVVNRQWAALFGQGLVRSTGDFGVQGDVPTHPELLDWLAVELMDSGWSLKSLHRLIVTSATYRQSSAVSSELLSLDPLNRLLARAPRLRVEAEAIRDISLEISGLLSDTMSGPPVYPPQPDGVVDVAYGKNDWKVSEGQNRFRRGLYTFLKRTAPFAMLTTFDGPTGESCVAQRETSNTPLQALTLLNDPAINEAAGKIGTRLAGESRSDADRLRDLFRHCTTRVPSDLELNRLVQFVGIERDRARQNKEHSEQAIEIEVWTAVARALLNLDETVMRN